MGAHLPFLIVVGGLAAVLGLFTWLAAHVRRRGLAGGAMGAALASYEEAFRITAHESHAEVLAQTRRKAPLLSPDHEWHPAGKAAAPLRPRTPRTRRGLGRWGERLRRGGPKVRRRPGSGRPGV